MILKLQCISVYWRYFQLIPSLKESISQKRSRTVNPSTKEVTWLVSNKFLYTAWAYKMNNQHPPSRRFCIWYIELPVIYLSSTTVSHLCFPPESPTLGGTNRCLLSVGTPVSLASSMDDGKSRSIDPISTPMSCWRVTPPKFKRSPWKRKFLLETIIFRFHVNLWECRYLFSDSFAKKDWDDPGVVFCWANSFQVSCGKRTFLEEKISLQR